MSRRTEQKKWKRKKKSIGIRNMKRRKSTVKSTKKSCEKRGLEMKLEILLIRYKSQCTLKDRLQPSETFDRGEHLNFECSMQF